VLTVFARSDLGHVALIVEKGMEGLSTGPRFDTLGLRANHLQRVHFKNVRVPAENLLGEPGDGFRIAQKRLGPGRIHHVMRWLGQMQRAFELLCQRALEREAFGSRLADKQTVQNWIADSAAQMQAARLMTLHAAWTMDTQGASAARQEVSLIKFFAARVLHEVIDRAVQTHGARVIILSDRGVDRTHVAIPMLLAMGADPASARGSLRLSLGHTSTEADVDAALAVLPAAVERARQAALASAGAAEQ